MGVSHLVSYDHVVLTDDEINEALRQARKKKDAEIKLKEYMLRISQPVIYQKETAHELLQRVLFDAANEYSEFQIDGSNQMLFHLLALYFSGDPEFERNQLGFSLQKGLMMYGPIGCGKTTILELFHRNSFQSYVIAPCRDVVNEYNTGGPEALERYKHPLKTARKDLYFGQSELALVFDDLGTEPEGAHFGKKINVMEDVLMSRYQNYELRGPMTHLTLNIIPDEIEERYGARLRSRMREMFNIIPFPEDAPDRRK